MSAAATTPKPSKGNPMGMLGILLIFGAIAFFGIPLINEYFWPRQEEGLRQMNDKVSDYVEARADEIIADSFDKPEQYMRKNGTHDPGKWFNTAMGAANNVRDDRRMASAVLARANDRDERIPQAIVHGSDADWVTVSTTQIPTHITVPIHDMITPPWRGDEKTNADGRSLDPVRHRSDMTVLMKERQDMEMPMTNVGNLDELIGRFCNNGSCGPGFPMGSDSVLCVGPGFHNGGTLQLWRNGLRVQGRVPMLADFAAGGKYNAHIDPDDPISGQLFATSMCAGHPEALVIKLSHASATTLVAQR